MNGHIEVRITGKGAKRYRPILFVDAEHGGPRRIYLGTFARLRGEDGAEAALERALAEWSAAGPTGPCKLTVRQLIERWLRDGPPRKPTTIAAYREAAKDHIYGIAVDGVVLSEEVASRTTPAQWAAWQAAQLVGGKARGGSCSAKSVRDYRTVVHGAFAWACEIGLLAVRPRLGRDG